jgi:hypothetical protein
MVADTLEALAEKLAESGVHSPTVSALISGRLIQSTDARHVLFCLGEPTRRALAHWMALSWSTYASLVCLPSSQLGVDDTPGRHDLPLLTGHGCVLASRGVSGDPLAGMPVNQLRDELSESRQRLSEAAGYQVRWLAPTPTALGTAVDGLVLEEARRAGYRRVLHPGTGLFDLDDDPIADQPGGCARLSYRPVQTDDTVDELVRWVRDERLSRPAARLRQLTRTPRRLLERFRDSD